MITSHSVNEGWDHELSEVVSFGPPSFILSQMLGAHIGDGHQPDEASQQRLRDRYFQEPAKSQAHIVQVRLGAWELSGFV